MENKDGSSPKSENVIKVSLKEKPSVQAGGFPPPMMIRDEADYPGVKKAYDQLMELHRCQEDPVYFLQKYVKIDGFAEIDRQQTIEKWRPLFENPIKKMVQQKKYQMPLFPKPNSKNSKRRERLNTAAGLPAKKRCFFRSLKRQFGKIPKEQRSAHVVVAPLDRNQEPIISAIFLVKELILDSLDGCSIYGCAAFNATMNGSSVIVVPHDFKKKDFGKKYSSGTITIR